MNSLKKVMDIIQSLFPGLSMCLPNEISSCSKDGSTTGTRPRMEMTPDPCDGMPLNQISEMFHQCQLNHVYVASTEGELLQNGLLLCVNPHGAHCVYASFCYQHSSRARHCLPVHCASSDQSPQSFSPSHFHHVGMQRPFLHSYWKYLEQPGTSVGAAETNRVASETVASHDDPTVNTSEVSSI